MRYERMAPDTKIILEKIEELIQRQVSIGGKGNIIKNVLLGWWGDENSRATTTEYNDFSDSVICYFPSFKIIITKLANNTRGNGKNKMYADSMIEKSETNIAEVNNTLNKLNEILEVELINVSFEKFQFYENLDW